MPIVRFYLVDGTVTPEQERRLLREASTLYADILECPVDRIRAFALRVPAGRAAVGGRVVEEGAPAAPYFEFLVLEGRPLEQRQALLGGFTDLIGRLLDIDKAVIRGRCIRVDPDEWSIGGVPASTVRQRDIASFSGRP